MIWQDYAIAITTLVFPVALAPAIARKEYPPFVTSLTTGIALVVISQIALTIPLFYTAAVNLLTGVMWLLLAYLDRRK